MLFRGLAVAARCEPPVDHTLATAIGGSRLAILGTVRSGAGPDITPKPKRAVGQALRINTINCQVVGSPCIGTPDRDDILGRPVAGTKIEARAANDTVTGGAGDDIINGEGADDDRAREATPSTETPAPIRSLAKVDGTGRRAGAATTSSVCSDLTAGTILTVARAMISSAVGSGTTTWPEPREMTS